MLTAVSLFASALDPGIGLPFAHNTGFPHQEPSGGGGTGAFVIVAVVCVTLATVAFLVWLDRRGRRREDRE
jgi:hypothetical protein